MVEIIAEVGINHNGRLDIAFDLIRMAKECGADAVKFQKRDIDTCYTPEFLASPRDSPWGRTQGDQKRGLEFDRWQYDEIDQFCKEIGILWFASAWDLKSLEFLECYKGGRHKIASTMLTNGPFIKAVAECGRPTLISTGAATLQQIDWAANVFASKGCEFALMHCVMEYPCPDNRCNVGMVQTLKNRYPGIEVGYSGHEVGIGPSVVAAALGATIIERHITIDRSMYGSDQSASLERRGLALLVKYCREVEVCIGDGKKVVTEYEAANAAKMRYWL